MVNVNGKSFMKYKMFIITIFFSNKVLSIQTAKKLYIAYHNRHVRQLPTFKGYTVIPTFQRVTEQRGIPEC